MRSALQRGAAIAAAGGGRPSARTQEPARARSSNEAEAQAIRDAKKQEALRWQLGGVTAELEEARRELSKLQAAFAVSEARARLVIQQDVALQELAEDVHAAAEEAHREQQHRIVHAEAEEAHRQQQLRRNQH